MKKIVMLFAAAAMTVSVAFAQDINAVTEMYNNGAMELEMGNKESALNYFQSAITEAEALGEAGVELIANCQMMIPAVMISLANDFIEADNLDAAMEWLAKAEEAANTYGDTDNAAKANEKKEQVLMKKAAELLCSSCDVELHLVCVLGVWRELKILLEKRKTLCCLAKCHRALTCDLVCVCVLKILV